MLSMQSTTGGLGLISRGISCLVLSAAIGLGGAAAAKAQQGEMKVSSSWSITRHEDGKSIQVQQENGKVSASVDGKRVPDDRVKLQNGVVTVLDENGKVILEQEALFSNGVGGADNINVFNLGGAANGDARGRLNTRNRAAVKVEPPKVMIGVQFIEPDASIRGHFDLKEGDSTMVSAVHQGLPASVAGIEPYDIVVAINGQSPASPKVIRQVLKEREPGQQVTLDVIHKGSRKTLTITTEKYDEEKLGTSKVDAIASAGDWGGLGGATGGDAEGLARDLKGVWNQEGLEPFVFRWQRPGGAMNGQVFVAPDDMMLDRNTKAMAERAQAQADAIRKQMGGINADANRLVEERMKRMEQMLEQMMQRQVPVPPPAESKKDEKRS